MVLNGIEPFFTGLVGVCKGQFPLTHYFVLMKHGGGYDS